eukprot:CAMPEP_0174351200 /NCGR_PEP_ID=MMETSP0811_2-20130205/8486_1 /TAXON_ID=73025 ORGANISM="Eutreptiella gymnastica-like, Strain CCMP1594" /NCGR_SAMPLE_ID=MMETSP0811_2 /ASSEMBLY_ACC=CAM_ASM_000667 /LENGTH=430 /DNA_ID=CAMNT_0015480191 /DNA_START=34 /DNA_END=1326 /DNA_ORIENTATION=-
MSPSRGKHMISLSYTAAFVNLGIAGSLFGPCLLQLAHNTCSTLMQMSALLTSRSLLYCLGSGIAGPIFERIENSGRCTALALLATGLSSFPIPFITNYYILVAVATLQGFMMGCLDCGGNYAIVQLHGGDGPEMQLLHFGFGLGAWLGPTAVGIALQFAGMSWAWAGVGVVHMAMGLVFCALPPLRKTTKPEPETETACEDLQRSPGHGINRVALIVFCCIFLLVYVGLETAVGNFLAVYGEMALHMSKETATWLTSVYWGGLAIGRLLAIPLSMVLSAKSLLFLDLAGSVGTVTLFWLYPSGSLVWVTAGLLGLCFASAFASLLGFADRCLQMTGKLTGVLMFFAAVGEFSSPLITGWVLQQKSVWYFSYLIAFSVCLTFVVFLMMICIAGTLEKTSKQRTQATVADIQLPDASETIVDNDNDQIPLAL